MPRVPAGIRAVSGTWSLRTQAHSTPWPAPPGATQLEDSTLAWDQDRERVAWEIHPQDSGPPGETGGGSEAPRCIGTCMNETWPFSSGSGLTCPPTIKRGQENDHRRADEAGQRKGERGLEPRYRQDGGPLSLQPQTLHRGLGTEQKVLTG